ncbi:hypothetical protein [Streptomyces sp. NPDC004250]|uniref:hypothetical protein n=1 Tax=Streptomyces sp. NPDC004250 TaxID=3364692 RepID=UPI003678D461
MSPAERRALLGDDVIAHIHQVVDDAPAPTPEVVEDLRRIFTRPLGVAPVKPRPAAKAA